MGEHGDMCLSFSATQESMNRIVVQACLGIKQDTISKMTDRVVQVVKHLPSKSKSLTSTPSTAKKQTTQLC
jgi:hypothetical protein